MSNIPESLKYTKEHEWLKLEAEDAVIGITDHAQESLGDITFVELPAEGDSYEAGDTFGVVESVKAASDLYMPVSGEITAVNQELEDSPESLNEDPYEAGWLIKIKVKDSSELENLLSPDSYKELV